MTSTNRRHNWKNDLFIKFMVTLCTIMIGNSYKTISENVIETNKFMGEMREFKNRTLASFGRIDDSMDKRDIIINKLSVQGANTNTEQSGRTDDIDYVRKLRNGDSKTINRLCSIVIEGGCN